MAIVYSAGSRLWHFAAINLFRASHQFLTTFHIDYLCLGIKRAKGAFTNYVNKILPIIDHLPTPCWHLWRNSFTVIRKNLHTVDISRTTYLPRLVNVVCKHPLTWLFCINNSRSGALVKARHGINAISPGEFSVRKQLNYFYVASTNTSLLIICIVYNTKLVIL